MLLLRIALIVITLTPAFAAAQIVNIQGQLAKPPEKNGVTGQVEAKVEWRTGNNPILDLGGQASLLVRYDRVLVLALARAGYGTSSGLVLTKKTFEHLRTRITLDCHWRWEAFAQHEYDQFRRLLVRGIVGTGPAFAVIQEKTVSMLVGAAYMLEYERLDSRDGTTDAGNRSVFHRGSAYVTATETLSTSLVAAQTVYVQPRFAEPSDVRVLAEVSLTSKLSKRLALTNAFILAYDRTPPDEIEALDTQLTVSLLVTI